MGRLRYRGRVTRSPAADGVARHPPGPADVSPAAAGLQLAEESAVAHPADDLSVGRLPDVLAVRGPYHQIEAIALSRRGRAAEDPSFDHHLVPVTAGSSG